MAKKKKDSRKKKVKEIKRKIKEIKEEVKESDLEKDIEKTEEKIENTEFREFLQPIKVSAPVLRKVETTAQEPLELNIASSPITQTKETGIDYTTGNEAQNQPKYARAIDTNNFDERRYESEFKAPVLRPTESGRFREEILTQQRPRDVQEIEDTSKIETRTLEQGRREPFGREDKKYREVNF